MHFQIVSDIHGGFNKVKWDPKADYILAAGDISENLQEAVAFLSTAPVPVFYVAGNHEYYRHDILETQDTLRKACEQTQGKVTFLEKDVIELPNQTRLLGCTLWSSFDNFNPLLVEAGLYQMNDCRMIHTHSHTQNPSWAKDLLQLSNCHFHSKRKLQETPRYQQLLKMEKSGFHRQKKYDSPDVMRSHHEQGLLTPAIAFLLHKESVAWLEYELSKPYSGKTLILTHHAPSRLALSMSGYAVNMFWSNQDNLPGRIARASKIGAYATDLDYLMQRYGIQGWVHGHLHTTMHYQVQQTPIFCNPTRQERQQQTHLQSIQWDKPLPNQQYVKDYATNLLESVSLWAYQCAHHTIEVNGLQVQAILDEINVVLQAHFPPETFITYHIRLSIPQNESEPIQKKDFIDLQQQCQRAYKILSA